MPSPETLNGRGTLIIPISGKTNFSYTIRTESGSGGAKVTTPGTGGNDGNGNPSGGDGIVDGTGNVGEAGYALLDGVSQSSGSITIPDGSQLQLVAGGGHGALAGGGGGQQAACFNISGSDIIGTLTLGAAGQNSTFTVGGQTITAHKGSNASGNTPGAGGTGVLGSIDALDISVFDGIDGTASTVTLGGGGQGANYGSGTIPNSFFIDTGATKVRVQATDTGIEIAGVIADDDGSMGDVTLVPGQSASGSIGGFNDGSPITEDFFGTCEAHIGGDGTDGDNLNGGTGGGPATSDLDGVFAEGSAEDTDGVDGKGGGGENLVAPGAFSPSIVTVSYDIAPIITSNGGGDRAIISVNEGDTAVTTVTTDITATFSKSGPDAGLFTINASTGALAFAAAPDYEVPRDSNVDNFYDLTVTATNDAGSDSQVLVVKIVNDTGDDPAPDAGTAELPIAHKPLFPQTDAANYAYRHALLN